MALRLRNFRDLLQAYFVLRPGTASDGKRLLCSVVHQLPREHVFIRSTNVLPVYVLIPSSAALPYISFQCRRIYLIQCTLGGYIASSTQQAVRTATLCTSINVAEIPNYETEGCRAAEVETVPAGQPYSCRCQRVGRIRLSGGRTVCLSWPVAVSHHAGDNAPPPWRQGSMDLASSTPYSVRSTARVT